jgi:D-amino peptidase
MKLLISADIEGIAGVTDPIDTVPGRAGYPQACAWMTREVAAACRGALRAGAAGIIVADSHGNAKNLLLDELPEEVEIVRSWPRPLSMMQGIEEGCTHVMMLGYHTGATSASGVLAHSFSGLQIASVTVNGAEMSELQVNAAVAAHYGAVITLVTGDEATCDHARTVLGDGVPIVAVKRDHGRLSATTMTPAAACKAIEAAAFASLTEGNSVPAVRVEGPLAVTMRFKHHWTAELLSYLPFVERAGAYEVRFACADIVELVKMLKFVTMYKPLPD